MQSKILLFFLRGNPLTNESKKEQSAVKRRWDDDVVFKNCARQEPEKKKNFGNSRHSVKPLESIFSQRHYSIGLSPKVHVQVHQVENKISKILPIPWTSLWNQFLLHPKKSFSTHLSLFILQNPINKKLLIIYFEARL